MASGVTTSVTQGMASALAASPTSDTWPNSSSVNGASATVITHCSRSALPAWASSRRSGWLPAGLGATPAPGSAANKMPTATKLSQKPACNSAHGSSATTTAQASNQTCVHGQRSANSRSRLTVASMQMVRCEGTPQPLNTA